MIWTIYKIWIVTSLILCYLAQKTEKDIYGFIAIIERMLGAGKGSFDFVRQLFK